MAEELVTLQVAFISWYGDDPADFEEMEAYLKSQVPEGVRLEKRHPRVKKPEYKTRLTEDTLEEFLLERLKPEVYESMGREYRDLEGLSRSELWRLALPYERGGGGGGPIFDYVFELLTSDTSTTIATISGLTLVTKELVQNYFKKDQQRSITIKRGDDEVTVSGYSPKEAEKVIEEVFARIRREKLSK